MSLNELDFSACCHYVKKSRLSQILELLFKLAQSSLQK